MLISSRFTVAVHTLALIDMNDGKVTSEYIAGSVNTNAAVIRRIMGMLSRAQLIASRPGVVGIKLLKPLREITLLDVYRAVELPEKRDLFSIHQNTNIECLVGKNIQSSLTVPLKEAQHQMERVLQSTTLEQIVQDIKAKR
ncbi:Rrf2 family transcriptional regulator [Paenibacillus ginsengihumi]|uniref:Rrf2 family transcriptional regulator n=1 Tax=Paenibacillus ginsengihumi TaxID=431596 RepID=UPI0003745AD9|nr:Rrf2 family transcriptional regulator [Paenibacillus ginsengihumi]